MNYFKSPMNYMGNKYRLLKQIVPLFPENIDMFVDLFCGGLDVSLNVICSKRICNDIEEHIIDFYKHIQKESGIEVDKKISKLIEEYKLSILNTDGYNQLRNDYNLFNRDDNWVLFYTLLCYSFSHQIRYNSDGKFNISFGKNRSEYNNSLKKRLIEFVDKIDENYIFENKDFRELLLICEDLTPNSFVYCDPPYLITLATYNERGGWGEKEEKDLLNFLDTLNSKGVKFGLSNVLSINGKENLLLKEWSEKYNVHHLNYNYGNSSYHKKDKSVTNTDEVYVCNY